MIIIPKSILNRKERLTSPILLRAVFTSLFSSFDSVKCQKIGKKIRNSDVTIGMVIEMALQVPIIPSASMTNDMKQIKNMTPIALSIGTRFLHLVINMNTFRSEKNCLNNSCNRLTATTEFSRTDCCPFRFLNNGGMYDLTNELAIMVHIKMNEAGAQYSIIPRALEMKADESTAMNAPNKLESTPCS